MGLVHLPPYPNPIPDAPSTTVLSKHLMLLLLLNAACSRFYYCPFVLDCLFLENNYVLIRWIVKNWVVIYSMIQSVVLLCLNALYAMLNKNRMHFKKFKQRYFIEKRSKGNCQLS